MAKLVTGLFKTRSSAMLAVEDLMRHGVPQEDISVMMTDTSRGREFFTDLASKAPEGAMVGTIIGGIIGGIFAALISLGYIRDPGIGLVGFNVYVSTLSGIGAGMLIGLIIGALIGSSVPEYELNLHNMDRRHSGILVGVYCHERRLFECRKLLEAAGGADIRTKSMKTEPVRMHTTREDFVAAGQRDQRDELLPPQ